ncbi:MAG: cell division protein ZapA, partial [Deltaproteobacteria bacterium]|nr:cell division protein ZapA [Deltaproteobacteria bacterium]
MANKKTFEIVLDKQSFRLKSEEDEKHVKQVAEYVNRQIFDIKKKTQSVSSHHVALLAALNIADEYFKLKEELKSKKVKAKAKIKEIKHLI